MMQREFPTIDFANQAEVRSNAERRRTEEMTVLLKTAFDRWTIGFHRMERVVFDAVESGFQGWRQTQPQRQKQI